MRDWRHYDDPLRDIIGHDHGRRFAMRNASSRFDLMQDGRNYLNRVVDGQITRPGTGQRHMLRRNFSGSGFRAHARHWRRKRNTVNS